MRNVLLQNAFRGRSQVLIEIGSNSVKYVVCRIKEDNMLEYLVDRNEITALGESLVSSGKLSKDAIDRTVQSIERFLCDLDPHYRERILTVGTMALRRASNSRLFEKKLKKLGLDLFVLSGDEEAELSFRGVVSDLSLSDEKSLLFDTGGGSTEFIEILDGKKVNSLSLEIGAVSLNEMFLQPLPVTERNLENASLWIKNQLRKMSIEGSPLSLIGTGGNVITMLSVKEGMPIWEKDNFSEAILSESEIDRQISIYSRFPVEKIMEIPGMERKRATIILAGSCIVKSIMEYFSVSNLLVSTRGMRHGLIKVLFETAIKR